MLLQYFSFTAHYICVLFTMKMIGKAPVGLGVPQPTVGQRNPSSSSSAQSANPEYCKVEQDFWNMNFLLDPISIMFHTKPHPAYSNGIGFHVQSSIHASGCAFASPKVSLEVTLPLHQGSAWDVGSSTSPCQGLQYWSLQILLQIDFNPILSLKTHSHNTGWSYEKSEEEEEARTIVCRPADFIWSCVSFAAGNKSVRHSAQKNTASNSVGMLNIMTVPNDKMNWDTQFPYKLARRQ